MVNAVDEQITQAENNKKEFIKKRFYNEKLWAEISAFHDAEAIYEFVTKMEEQVESIVLQRKEKEREQFAESIRNNNTVVERNIHHLQPEHRAVEISPLQNIFLSIRGTIQEFRVEAQQQIKQAIAKGKLTGKQATYVESAMMSAISETTFSHTLKAIIKGSGVSPALERESSNDLNDKQDYSSATSIATPRNDLNNEEDHHFYQDHEKEEPLQISQSDTPSEEKGPDIESANPLSEEQYYFSEARNATPQQDDLQREERHHFYQYHDKREQLKRSLKTATPTESEQYKRQLLENDYQFRMTQQYYQSLKDQPLDSTDRKAAIDFYNQDAKALFSRHAEDAASELAKGLPVEAFNLEAKPTYNPLTLNKALQNSLDKTEAEINKAVPQPQTPMVAKAVKESFSPRVFDQFLTDTVKDSKGLLLSNNANALDSTAENKKTEVAPLLDHEVVRNEESTYQAKRKQLKEMIQSASSGENEQHIHQFLSNEYQHQMAQMYYKTLSDPEFKATDAEVVLKFHQEAETHFSSHAQQATADLAKMIVAKDLLSEPKLQSQSSQISETNIKQEEQTTEISKNTADDNTAPTLEKSNINAQGRPSWANKEAEKAESIAESVVEPAAEIVAVPVEENRPSWLVTQEGSASAKNTSIEEPESESSSALTI